MSRESSTPGTPGLSRRSRYEALISKYEAAAEVVRTNADTDVQLAPQDNPIAEEEGPLPYQHSHPHRHGGSSHHEHEVDGGLLADTEAPAGESSSHHPRPSQMSLGGAPSIGAAAPLSPALPRRGSAAVLLGSGVGGGCGGSNHGSVMGGAMFDDGDLEAGGRAMMLGMGMGSPGGGGAGEVEAAGGEQASIGSIAAGIGGALGGLASLAGLHLGGGGGGGAGGGGGGAGPFTAAAAAAAAAAAGEPETSVRPPRKHRAEKPKKVPLLSSNWLKIDYTGLDTIIRVDRHKLMHKLGVQARDLRLLDLTSITPPAILGRDKAIIVNLWHIRAIITLDYCLVVAPEDTADPHERSLVAAFVAELKAKLAADHNLKSGRGGGEEGPGGTGGRSYVGLARGSAGYGSLHLPFELKVLEVCLDMTAAQLDEATKVLEADAYPNLDDLTRKVTAVKLERARRIKNRLVRLTKSVQSVREILERLLNDDGDMHRLHLTGAELSRQVSMRPSDLGRLSAGLPPSEVDSDSSSSHSSNSSIDEAETAAVEMLLEAYFMLVDQAYNRLLTVDEYIKDTEDLVTIQLDQHRNQLITIDLMLTALNTTFGVLTVVGGYFGMNLNSGLQEKAGLFNAVVLTSTLGSLGLLGLFIVWLHRQKLLYT